MTMIRYRLDTDIRTSTLAISLSGGISDYALIRWFALKHGILRA